jgi:hypothetical protein
MFINPDYNFFSILVCFLLYFLLVRSFNLLFQSKAIWSFSNSRTNDSFALFSKKRYHKRAKLTCREKNQCRQWFYQCPNLRYCPTKDILNAVFNSICARTRIQRMGRHPIQALAHWTIDIVPEFLTEETTCANVMSERTTSQNHCQKRPLRSGGTPRQATRGTCRLGQCRQGGAAIPISGRSGCHSAGGPCRHLPPTPVAAGWRGSCRHSLCRHPARLPPDQQHCIGPDSETIRFDLLHAEADSLHAMIGRQLWYTVWYRK